MWHVAKLCFFLKWLLIDYCFVDTILDVNCVGGKQKVPASTKMELLSGEILHNISIGYVKYMA